MLLKWFKSLSLGWKAFVVLFTIAFIGYQIMSVQYQILHHKLINQIIEEKTILEDKKKANNQKQDKAINRGETVTRKVQDEIIQINQKSKENAQAIDNADYSDAKLDSLLASYD